MHAEHSLIATISVGLTYAFFGGLIANRLRLPPLVGYLLAGIAVGPFTPGFIADPKLAPQLAEIGVILLMFGVGTHFSIRDLWAVKRIAAPGAVAQMMVATAMGIALARSWGWPVGQGLVLGLALSVASTVVLLRALEDEQLLDSRVGRIAVGWLIVEDLAMVLTVILLPAFASLLGSESAPKPENGAWPVIGLTLVKVGAFVAIMQLAGTRVLPWLLHRVEMAASRELFTLAAIAVPLGIAFASAEVFGVSLALGAFFAGVAIHESELLHRTELHLQPVQDVFSALFFVSVGMLFDPLVLLHHPLEVVAVVAIIVVGKSLAALAIVLMLGESARSGWTVAASLAQIGEFSFILAGTGLQLGLLPELGLSLIVAGALLSITLNPLLFQVLSRWSARPPRGARMTTD